MSSEARTAGELREHLVEKATADAEFRARLLSDPKAAIEQELGIAIPASLSIEVHEEDSATAHLILPPTAKLNEGDLQTAAGGRSFLESLFPHSGGNPTKDW